MAQTGENGKSGGDMVALSGTLKDGVHRLVARIYFADTDFSGNVYHGRYLEFLERGRTDMLRLAGIHHHELASGAAGPVMFWVVRDMALSFKASAHIDDVITVETRIASASGARVELAQAVICEGRLLVQAQVTAALIDADGRVCRLPKAWRAQFDQLAGADVS